MGNKHWLVETVNQLSAYLLWGVCTTVVNLLVFWIFRRCIGMPLLFANLVAWCTAVIFAYITNRSFVFIKGASTSAGLILREFRDFLAARVFTGVLDMVCMWVGSAILMLPEFRLKVVVNILVILSNYLFGKFFVFRRRTKG